MVKFRLLFILSDVFSKIFIWFGSFQSEKIEKRKHAYLNIPPSVKNEKRNNKSRAFAHLSFQDFHSKVAFQKKDFEINTIIIKRRKERRKSN